MVREKLRRLIVALEKRDESDEAGTYRYSSFDSKDGYFGEALLSKHSKVKCVYCGFNHWSDECQRFKTLQHRKGQVKG